MTDPDQCHLCGESSPEICFDCDLCSTCSPPPLLNDVGRCEDCAAAADQADDDDLATDDGHETPLERFLADTVRRHPAVRTWLEERRHASATSDTRVDPRSVTREPL